MNGLLVFVGSILVLVGVISLLLQAGEVPGGPEVKVGEVFVHSNPGDSNPDALDPFAWVYTVKEIRGDRFLAEGFYMHADGRSFRGDHWRDVESVKYDKKVK